MTYAEKLKDHRWLQLRQEIIELAQNRCSDCDVEGPLQVHHKFYLPGKDPWEYEYGDLRALCPGCHEQTERVRVKLLSLFGSFVWTEVQEFVDSFRAAVEHGHDPHVLLRSLHYTCAQLGSEDAEEAA